MMVDMSFEKIVVYTIVDLLSGHCRKHDFFTFLISRCEAGLKLSMNRHQFWWASLKYVWHINPGRAKN